MINFELTDETDKSKQPLTLVYTRQWAESETGCDLWSESAGQDQLEALLIKLQDLFPAAAR